MASVTFPGMDDYIAKMNELYGTTEEVLKKVVYQGANIISNEVRSNLSKVPGDRFRYLKDGEEFNVIADNNLKDLLDGLGIAPIKTDDDGNTNTKIGFNGYGRYPTKKYPNGIPNALLARAIESGSSVRKKTPFCRRAIYALKSKAEQKMKETCDEEAKKIMK